MKPLIFQANGRKFSGKIKFLPLVRSLIEIETMTKRTIVLFVFIVFSTLKLYAEENRNKTTRYYDFNIIIDFKDGLLSNDFKYILCNNGIYFDNATNQKYKLKKNVIHLVQYNYDIKVVDDKIVEANRIPIDTLMINFKENQLDTLFSLTTKLFDLSSLTNTTQHLIPLPPAPYDGYSANVVFDLGFRGDKYSIFIAYPQNNISFVLLEDYINNIVKKEQ